MKAFWKSITLVLASALTLSGCGLHRIDDSPRTQAYRTTAAKDLQALDSFIIKADRPGFGNDWTVAPAKSWRLGIQGPVLPIIMDNNYTLESVDAGFTLGRVMRKNAYDHLYYRIENGVRDETSHITRAPGGFALYSNQDKPLAYYKCGNPLRSGVGIITDPKGKPLWRVERIISPTANEYQFLRLAKGASAQQALYLTLAQHDTGGDFLLTRGLHTK